MCSERHERGDSRGWGMSRELCVMPGGISAPRMLALGYPR